MVRFVRWVLLLGMVGLACGQDATPPAAPDDPTLGPVSGVEVEMLDRSWFVGSIATAVVMNESRRGRPIDGNCDTMIVLHLEPSGGVHCSGGNSA